MYKYLMVKSPLEARQLEEYISVYVSYYDGRVPDLLVTEKIIFNSNSFLIENMEMRRFRN